MKIYLDMNVFNRMFDDQNQMIIKLETIAIDIIYELIGKGTFDLVWSYILEYENSKNPFQNRRQRVGIISQIRRETVVPNEDVIAIAEDVQRLSKAKDKDSLHLACSIYSCSKYLITCDNAFIRTINYNRDALSVILKDIEIINPLDFIRKVMNIDVIG